MTVEETHAGMTYQEASDLGRLVEWYKAKVEADAKYVELGRRVMEMPMYMALVRRYNLQFFAKHQESDSQQFNDSDPNAALIAAGVLLPEERG